MKDAKPERRAFGGSPYVRVTSDEAVPRPAETSSDLRPPPSARPVPPWTDPSTFDGWEAEVGRLVDRAAHLDAQADAAGGAIASAARKMANRLRAKALLLSREAQAVTGRRAP